MCWDTSVLALDGVTPPITIMESSTTAAWKHRASIALGFGSQWKTAVLSVAMLTSPHDYMQSLLHETQKQLQEV